MHKLQSHILSVAMLLLVVGCDPSEAPQPDEPRAVAATKPGGAPADAPPTREASAAPPPAIDESSAQRPEIVDSDGRAIPVTVGAAPGYVPDSSCRDCHALIHDTYQHVGMARSFYKPTLDNVIENYENGRLFHEPSARYYEMSHRDGVFYQKRYQLDGNGKRVNELEARVDFVIGSGNNVRTYVTRNEAGEFYQLPVSWYTQTRAWAMSPGYDNPSHAGFTRMVKRECMFCHNAYPEQPTGTDLLGQPFVYPRNLPHGIGCQRCHGPGAAHTRVAYDPQSGIRKLRESIVNPARLEPHLRDDVCLQCHLQPTASPSSFMRIVGRGDYSYKPGEPIQDYMLVVDYESQKKKAERFEINHHPYRLYQSPCYVNSEGAMSCMTCHDPHRKPEPSERAAYFQSKCLTCHQLDQCDAAAMAARNTPDHGANTDCVACHMPKHRAEDVIQVLATDHLIRRDPPPEAWTAPRKEHGKRRLPQPHAYSDERAPEHDALVLHLAMFAARRGSVKQLAAVVDAIEQAKPDSADAYLFLARLQETAGRYKDVEATYRGITERFPDVLGGHTGLAFSLSRKNRFREALVSSQRAVALNPASADAYHQLGTALLGLERIAEAGPCFERALALRPYHTGARANLATAYASIGNLRAAVAEYEMILAIDPLDTEACADLAAMLAFQRQTEQAVSRLEHAVRINPDAAKLHESLAMVLVSDNRFDEALVVAARARELQGSEAVSSVVESIAFYELGKRKKSLAAFQRMHAQRKGAAKSSVLYDSLQARAEHLQRGGRTP